MHRFWNQYRLERLWIVFILTSVFLFATSCLGFAKDTKAMLLDRAPAVQGENQDQRSSKISSNLLPLSITQHRQVVKRVVDGDTLVLSNGERVRLIGVDTPETKHPRKGVEPYGKEAAAFTRKMIEGKRVRLEYEWNQKDRYGRTLAYVFRDSDQFFLNAELIKQGYAHAYTRYPFRYLDEFRRYEKEARQQKQGLWAEGV